MAVEVSIHLTVFNTALNHFIILFSRFISIKAIMRQSINIYPRSACHKIMVENFRHWPN